MGCGPKGELYVCNFGDAQLREYILDEAGKVKSERVVAEGQGMKSVDGLMVDTATGDVYIADFLGSAVHRVAPATGKVTLIHANPENNDGSGNKLDKCSEVRKRGIKLYVSNIDLPFDGNAADTPNTISIIEIPKGWATPWTVMTVLSAGALVLFFLFFWDKPKEADEDVKEEVAEKAESA